MVIGEGFTDQIFTHVMGIHFQLGINAHRIPYELQVTEGNPRFKTVDRNAPVSTQYIINVQFPNPFFSLFLKCGGRRRKVRILIAEQLIGDFTCKQYPDICMLMNPFAYKIHTDGCANGGYIPGPEKFHNSRESRNNILFRDYDLGVVAADIVGNLTRIFQIDRVYIHADRESTDRLIQHPLRNSADQGGIQTAGQQETHRRIRVQPFLHTVYQEAAKLCADILFTFHCKVTNICGIGILDELPVNPVISRREWQDLLTKSHQILWFAGKDPFTVIQASVVQRPDADRVAGGNQLFLFSIPQDQGKFCIQSLKHFDAILVIQWKQDLAV